MQFVKWCFHSFWMIMNHLYPVSSQSCNSLTDISIVFERLWVIHIKKIEFTIVQFVKWYFHWFWMIMYHLYKVSSQSCNSLNDTSIVFECLWIIYIKWVHNHSIRYMIFPLFFNDYESFIIKKVSSQSYNR